MANWGDFGGVGAGGCSRSRSEILIIFGSYRSVLLDWKEDHQSCVVNVVDPLISCLSQRKSGDKPGEEMYHLC